MEAIEFKEQSIVIGKDQDEYNDLPAFQHHDECQTVTFCWRPSFRERVSLIFGGKVWHSVMTFGAPLQPQRVLGTKPELIDCTKVPSE